MTLDWDKNKTNMIGLCLICGSGFVRSNNSPNELLPDVCCSCHDIKSLEMEGMSFGVSMEHIERCKLLDKIERSIQFLNKKDFEL